MKLSIIFLILILSIGFVSAFGQSVNCSADQSITLCYKFNNDNSVGENYGVSNVIYDYSNSHNNGTNTTILSWVSNSSWLNDGSFNFNRQFNSILVNNKSSIDTSQGLTVMAWINTNNLNNDKGDIVTRYLANNGNRSWGLYISGGRLAFAGSTDGITVQTASSSINTIHNNSGWIFVVGLWNGTTLVTYVNGIKSINVAPTLSSLVQPSLIPIEIGRGRIQTDFNGSIDDVIIFNKSLSDSQIWNYFYNYRGCINFSLDNQIGGNMTACQNNYYINGSTSQYDGALKISTINNAIIDLNGSTINGNLSLNSSGIYISNSNNITIKNGIINNYQVGVYSTSSNGNIVYNNTFNNNNVSIQMGICDNSNISNNLINESLLIQGLNYAIHFYSSINGNNYIGYNNIIGSSGAVFIETLTNNSIVEYNNVKNTNGTSLVFGSTAFNNIIRFNNVNNSYWNSISTLSDNNIVYNNTIYFSGHNAFDLNGCSNAWYPKNNTFYFNKVYNGYPSNNVYLCTAINNYFHDEYYYNVTGEVMMRLNSNSSNNVFRNIYSDTSPLGGVYVTRNSNNNSFINLTLKNSGNYQFYFMNISSFNLNGLSGMSYYNIYMDNSSVKFQNISSYDFLKIISNTLSNAISFFNLTNIVNSFILYSNSSSQSNVNGDINISLNPNEWVYIYSDGSCPDGWDYQGSGTCTFTPLNQKKCISFINSTSQLIPYLAIIFTLIIFGVLLFIILNSLNIINIPFEMEINPYSIFIILFISVLVISIILVLAFIINSALCSLVN